MQGPGITIAIETLNLFMHSLPVRSKFAIVTFGTNHEWLGERSLKEYSNETLQKVKTTIETYRTSFLGCTNVLRPLQDLFGLKESSENYKKQEWNIFLLTDGAVDNYKGVK